MTDKDYLRKKSILIVFFITIITISSQSHAESLLSLFSKDPNQKKQADTCSTKLLNEKFDKSIPSKGIVIDKRDIESVEMSYIQSLFSENRKPLFVYGSNISPQNFYKMFDISPKIYTFREKNIDQIQATGVFRRAIGTFYTINISSRGKIPFCMLMSHIDAAVNRMLNADKLYPTVKKGNLPYWENDGSKHEEQVEDYDSQGKLRGLFRQNVDFWLLRNDSDSVSDWWYIHINNEVIPGEDYATKLNKNNAKGMNAEGLPCWGPRDVVRDNSEANVKIGGPCPGPEKQWKWKTGMTTVEDHTEDKDSVGRWEVKFQSGKKDSNSAHKWEPGAEYETKEKPNKELRVRMDVTVDWQDTYGGVKTWIPESWTFVGQSPY